MPVCQVTCERSFSKMKIIKNYLRNSMSDKRLSDLTILATWTQKKQKIINDLQNIEFEKA